MILTLKIERHQTGDILIRNAITSGYLWRQGKKFIGIEVEKQERLHISDETEEGIEKQLTNWAKVYNIPSFRIESE